MNATFLESQIVRIKANFTLKWRISLRKKLKLLDTGFPDSTAFLADAWGRSAVEMPPHSSTGSPSELQEGREGGFASPGPLFLQKGPDLHLTCPTYMPAHRPDPPWACRGEPGLPRAACLDSQVWGVGRAWLLGKHQDSTLVCEGAS